MTDALVQCSQTHVLPPEFDRRYPMIVAGDGVWATDAAGRRYLDAMSGGSMALTLGHGRADLIEAARAQAQQLAFVHNERLTNPAEQRLARELTAVAPEGMDRVHFVTGGAEANECALRIARSYHVERGEPAALARDLAGAVLPRPDDGDARAHRAAGTAGAADALTCQSSRTSRRARGALTRPASRRSQALDAALEQAGPRTSRRSSARSSARPRCRPTWRRSASGRGSPSAASGTAS